MLLSIAPLKSIPKCSGMRWWTFILMLTGPRSARIKLIYAGLSKGLCSDFESDWIWLLTRGWAQFCSRTFFPESRLKSKWLPRGALLIVMHKRAGPSIISTFQAFASFGQSKSHDRVPESKAGNFLHLPWGYVKVWMYNASTGEWWCREIQSTIGWVTSGSH